MKITSMEQFGKAIDEGYDFEENFSSNQFYQDVDWPSYSGRDLKKFVASGYIRTKPKTIELYEHQNSNALAIWVNYSDPMNDHTMKFTGRTATATINDEDKP